MVNKPETFDRGSANGWMVAYWILFIGWLAGAVLTMSHVRGGFLTNYLSDLVFPPWFYILLRELVPGKRVIPWIRWFGRSPERAAVSIFSVGVISEVSQRYWPRGFFAGTYDPWDIAAYAIGLVVCYGIEKFIAGRLRNAPPLPADNKSIF